MMTKDNTKDKKAVLFNSFVVYAFSSLGCGSKYICKTERLSHEKTMEHAWTDNKSAA